jgi:hypothetical protein
MNRPMGLLLFALGCSCVCADEFVPSPGHTCDSATAQLVEERLGAISDWHEFATFYRAFNKCDRPALSYGFTQRVAALATNPTRFSQLQEEIKRYPALKKVVLTHLRSEAIPLDQVEKIRDATGSACPRSTKRLCKELLEAVNSGTK